jgi:hypothetical protein
VRMIRRGNHCVARSATKSDAKTRTHFRKLREIETRCGKDFARSAGLANAFGVGVRCVFASLWAAKRCWSYRSVCESESAD